MKAFLFSLIAAAGMIACNNNKAPEVAGSASPANETTATAKAASTGETGCSSFLWFKEGTTLEYNLTDVMGKNIVTTTHISKVRNDGSGLVADFTNTYGTKEVKGTYRCSGDKLYMDMKSFFENNFSALKRAGIEIEMSNSDISFPLNMQPGDKLEEARFTAKTKKNGKEFMTMSITIKDRKVEGTEKVTTPGGTWDCLKLSQVQSSVTEMMGKQVKGPDTKAIQWFSRDGGLVKFETYDASGKLQTKQELISIK
jgi:hypothetical protein